jgi:hypothetical protein
MSTATGRSRERRSLRLEYLEDRNLLSVLKSPGIAAEVLKASAAPITSITGLVVGSQASAGLYAAARPGDTSYSGHGTATPVGFVYIGLEQKEAVDPTNAATLDITKGQGLLTTFKGDQITFAYTGTGQIHTHGRTNVLLNGTVTGGTGRFNAVTGTFTAVASFRAGKFNASFSLSLVHPG